MMRGSRDASAAAPAPPPAVNGGHVQPVINSTSLEVRESWRVV